MKRTSIWIAWSAILVMLIMGMVGIRAQSGSELERRVQQIEETHPDRRISVVETRLDTIEWLGKTILAGVLAQLVIQGLNFQRRREEAPEAAARRRPPVIHP